MTIHPVGVGMGRNDIGSGNPYVAVAVPAVISSVPGPIGMLMGRRWNGLIGTCWWTDANDDLGLRHACGE
jgi:hypothetical protein